MPPLRGMRAPLAALLLMSFAVIALLVASTTMGAIAPLSRPGLSPPTRAPTRAPTDTLTWAPTTRAPTQAPTGAPTQAPIIISEVHCDPSDTGITIQTTHQIELILRDELYAKVEDNRYADYGTYSSFKVTLNLARAGRVVTVTIPSFEYNNTMITAWPDLTNPYNTTFDTVLTDGTFLATIRNPIPADYRPGGVSFTSSVPLLGGKASFIITLDGSLFLANVHEDRTWGGIQADTSLIEVPAIVMTYNTPDCKDVAIPNFALSSTPSDFTRDTACFTWLQTFAVGNDMRGDLRAYVYPVTLGNGQWSLVVRVNENPGVTLDLPSLPNGATGWYMKNAQIRIYHADYTKMIVVATIHGIDSAYGCSGTGSAAGGSVLLVARSSNTGETWSSAFYRPDDAAFAPDEANPHTGIMNDPSVTIDAAGVLWIGLVFWSSDLAATGAPLTLVQSVNLGETLTFAHRYDDKAFPSLAFIATVPTARIFVKSCTLVASETTSGLLWAVAQASALNYLSAGFVSNQTLLVLLHRDGQDFARSIPFDEYLYSPTVTIGRGDMLYITGTGWWDTNGIFGQYITYSISPEESVPIDDTRDFMILTNMGVDESGIQVIAAINHGAYISFLDVNRNRPTRSPIGPGARPVGVHGTAYDFFNNQLWVAYCDKINPVTQFAYRGADDFPAYDAQMAIYAIYSTNDGETWSERIRISNTTVGDRANVALAISPETGVKSFFWWDGRNNQDLEYTQVQPYTAAATFILNGDA